MSLFSQQHSFRSSKLQHYSSLVRVCCTSWLLYQQWTTLMRCSQWMHSTASTSHIQSRLPLQWVRRLLTIIIVRLTHPSFIKSQWVSLHWILVTFRCSLYLQFCIHNTRHSIFAMPNGRRDGSQQQLTSLEQFLTSSTTMGDIIHGQWYVYMHSVTHFLFLPIFWLDYYDFVLKK